MPDVESGEFTGSFKTSINDKLANITFGGHSSDKWVWEDGGVFSLKRGEVALTLKDLTGWYGRCDAILLTANLGFSPPAAKAEIEEFKASIGCFREPAKAGGYDVIVIGGGLAGVSTSLAAARLGCKVALIQNRPVLGGNAGKEIKVHVLGTGSVKQYPIAREAGIVEELKLEMANKGYDWEKGWPSHIFLDAIKKKKA